MSGDLSDPESSGFSSVSAKEKHKNRRGRKKGKKGTYNINDIEGNSDVNYVEDQTSQG